MAHFLAEIQGARGPASRLGSKQSGISATTASWDGAVTVTIDHDTKTGKDIASVRLRPWHGHGVTRNLYHGPVAGPEKKELFSHAHYTALAQIMAHVKPATRLAQSGSSTAQWDIAITELAAMLECDNDNFDANQFLAACGLERETV